MKKSTATALAALVLLAACNSQEEPAAGGNETSANEVAAQLASVEVRPGLWQSNSEIVSASMPNMPREIASQLIGRRSAARHCITPEQAARPNANFLTTQENSDCTYSDFTMRGGRISGVMTCRGGSLPGEVRTRMEGQYGAESYDIRMNMVSGTDDATIRMETRTSGRRIGECSEGEAGA